jgi:hypothetical protein
LLTEIKGRAVSFLPFPLLAYFWQHFTCKKMLHIGVNGSTFSSE